MKYRALVDDDYSFGNGDRDFLTGIDAVAQAIKTNLLLLQGEWWESIEKGFPLFQNVLGSSGTPQHLQAADLLVQDTILNTPGVTRIKDYNSNYIDRKYSLFYTVETLYGDVASQEVRLLNVF